MNNKKSPPEYTRLLFLLETHDVERLYQLLVELGVQNTVSAVEATRLRRELMPLQVAHRPHVSLLRRTPGREHVEDVVVPLHGGVLHHAHFFEKKGLDLRPRELAV